MTRTRRWDTNEEHLASRKRQVAMAEVTLVKPPIGL